MYIQDWDTFAEQLTAAAQQRTKAEHRWLAKKQAAAIKALKLQEETSLAANSGALSSNSTGEVSELLEQPSTEQPSDTQQTAAQPAATQQPPAQPAAAQQVVAQPAAARPHNTQPAVLSQVTSSRPPHLASGHVPGYDGIPWTQWQGKFQTLNGKYCQPAHRSCQGTHRHTMH